MKSVGPTISIRRTAAITAGTWLVALVVVGPCAVGCAAADAAPSTNGHRITQRPKASVPDSLRVLHLTQGNAQAEARLPEPDGVILLARVAAPRNVRVSIKLTDSDIAGITFTNTPSKRDPSLSCRVQADTRVCGQAEEWCPMPAGTWRLRVTKATGPAADVRVDFVVGPKPRSIPTSA